MKGYTKIKLSFHSKTEWESAIGFILANKTYKLDSCHSTLLSQQYGLVYWVPSDSSDII